MDKAKKKKKKDYISHNSLPFSTRNHPSQNNIHFGGVPDFRGETLALNTEGFCPHLAEISTAYVFTHTTAQCNMGSHAQINISWKSHSRESAFMHHDKSLNIGLEVLVTNKLKRSLNLAETEPEKNRTKFEAFKLAIWREQKPF